MQIVINIPEEVKLAFECAESNDLKGCYYDHGGVIGNAIKNATPLPKGHGRLIDADANIKGLSKMEVVDDKDKQSVRFAIIELKNALTIIEADKECD